MAKKYIKARCTLKKENSKEVQQSLSIPSKRILKSTCVINQNLNNCEKSASSPLQKNYKDNRKLNEIQTSNVITGNCKTMLKDDLQRTIHLRNKSKISCSLCGNTFSSNKMLQEHQNKVNCTLNVEFQETSLTRFEIKSSEQKCLRAETCKSHKKKQYNSSNIQNLINSKCRTDCDFSLKIERENNCEISNSIITEESNKSIYTKDKKQKTVKSCHLEIKKRKKKNMLCENTIHKCKQDINKTDKNECFRSAVEKENTNNFSKLPILQQNKPDIKINKAVTENKNYLDVKSLVVPLIKIEDLPLSEVSKLIQTSNYVENVLNKQENKSIYYETKNITETQCSAYEEYRTTGVKQNEEINVLYHKSVFKRKCTKFKKELKKEINTNITNIKFETNTYKMSSDNNVCNKKTLQNNECKSQTTYLLQNILQFFLKNKNCSIHRRTRQRTKNLNSEKVRKCEIRKSVAMCNKCNEVFNLLQQFSNKTNFVQDEKLCIECTLCNLQINSLSHFQKHVMDVHLQCEGTLFGRKKRFTVVIINFNEQLNLTNKKRCIYECCCCLKIFSRITDFKKHIEKIHDRFNYCSDNIKQQETEEQVVNTSQLCTFKNKQILNKDNTLNKNYIFDITASLADIPNLGKETETQNNNHIDQYCINTEEMNFKNNMYYNNSNNENLLLTVEVKEKQIKNTEHSNITEIMKTVPNTKENIEEFKINEEYSNSITIISGSDLPTTSNDNIDQRVKECKRYEQSFFFVCNICFKKYKREHIFLIHMSKHMTDSLVDTNEKQKPQEDNNMIKLKNDLIVLNASTTNTQDYAKGFKDNNILNSSIDLEEPNKNTLISKIIDKKVDSVKNENIEYMTKEDSVTSETDDGYNCLLHINLIQNTKKGIKRQKSIKFNIHVTKRYKRSSNEQQNTQNEIKNMFPINLVANTSFIKDSSKGNIACGLKELRCNICHKKFSTLTILKEHMFFLHDSMFEGPELSNLPTIPYFNSYHKTKNLSTKNIPISQKKYVSYNASFKTKISKKVLQNQNKIHGKTIRQISNKNNINKMNKKWRCNPCKENFALLRNYLRHKYYCHNDESVVHICDNCNKILTSVAMVNIHMCTNVTSWTCNRCNINFSSGKSLTQHNMNYHMESVGPHICKVCKLNFLTTYMLTKHEATHSISEGCNNLNNFINLSTKNHLPYTEHNINVSNEVSKKGAQLRNNSTIICTNEDVKILKQLDELNSKLSEMRITSNIQHNNETILKCLHCNILCTTKLQLKLHLEKWHKEEMCQICNNLYPTDKLTKHLMCHHIVSDNLCFEENNINIQVTYENIAFQNDIIKILGLKRLLSLYEYQRFNNTIENKYFDCIICSKQFSSVQCYKIHYLKYHDTICLLCNITFKYNFQAFEHKIKIHKSVALYLWIVQKLIFGVLELNEYGNTIEEAILKYSETRIH